MSNAWAWPPSRQGVTTFNGRSGAVVPAAGDYNSTQITNAAATIVGADVTAALTTLRRGLIVPPPVAPSAFDEEFNGNTLPTGWTWSAAVTDQTGAFGIYSAPIALPSVDYGTYRASHMSVVTPYDNVFYTLSRSVTYPTNAWMEARMIAPVRSTAAGLIDLDLHTQFSLVGPGGNTVELALIYRNTGAGTPGIYYTLKGTSAGVVVGCEAGGAAPGTNAFWIATALNAARYTIFGIQKLGTKYFCYFGDDSGASIYVGTITVTGGLTSTSFGFRERSAATDPAFLPVKAIDYFRLASTSEGSIGFFGK